MRGRFDSFGHWSTPNIEAGRFSWGKTYSVKYRLTENIEWSDNRFALCEMKKISSLGESPRPNMRQKSVSFRVETTWVECTRISELETKFRSSTSCNSSTAWTCTSSYHRDQAGLAEEKSSVLWLRVPERLPTPDSAASNLPVIRWRVYYISVDWADEQEQYPFGTLSAVHLGFKNV